VNKEIVVYIYKGVVLSFEKGELPFMRMQINLEDIMQSEMSQTQEKEVLHDFIYI
jgi:hypothetical protein